jgi:hypothetical protein
VTQAATNDRMSTDADYGTDIDRCRGTLISHRDGALDCTDDDCALADPVRHALIVDCLAVLGGCCDVETADFARAS